MSKTISRCFVLLRGVGWDQVYSDFSDRHPSIFARHLNCTKWSVQFKKGGGELMSSTVKTPLEMFYRWEQETPDKVYLRQPSNLEWRDYTWREVADQVRRIAAFLISKNYAPGSRIAVWSANSKDWPIVDLAIMLSGHISVPVYPGQDIESANYIFNHSECRLAFLGAFDLSARADEALADGMETVAMLGCSIECGQSVDTIVREFEPYDESPVPDLEDIFTIIYTSGTTGNPKGVMHMHQTPGHVVPGLAKSFRMVGQENRLFSFLPMSHAAERIIVELISLYTNASLSFSEGLETFADEVRSVQPTFFFAVPRLWVKFKQGVDAKVPAEAQLNDEQKAGIARQLGLGEARCIITGSAPCPRDVQDWFLSMGIALRDGYGMTENFVHGCAWIKNDQPISGCVGQPMDESIQVRISDEGEIQFKSKGLMKGYYLEPEKTAEVFQDGWYCSGDSGKFDEDGNLWVTGRISEVFKTSKGKFVVPTRVEDFFGRCAHLGQFCVMGHGFDKPVLLATLSENSATLDEEML
ncbi:MAG: AMP-binding protein, partial [Gammaproteobacteria bacterium]|nr:AMP-binding protein [Gammaproteobacteria bacterium]